MNSVDFSFFFVIFPSFLSVFITFFFHYFVSCFLSLLSMSSFLLFEKSSLPPFLPSFLLFFPSLFSCLPILMFWCHPILSPPSSFSFLFFSPLPPFYSCFSLVSSPLFLTLPLSLLPPPFLGVLPPDDIAGPQPGPLLVMGASLQSLPLPLPPPPPPSHATMQHSLSLNGKTCLRVPSTNVDRWGSPSVYLWHMSLSSDSDAFLRALPHTAPPSGDARPPIRQAPPPVLCALRRSEASNFAASLRELEKVKKNTHTHTQRWNVWKIQNFWGCGKRLSFLERVLCNVSGNMKYEIWNII